MKITYSPQPGTASGLIGWLCAIADHASPSWNLTPSIRAGDRTSSAKSGHVRYFGHVVRARASLVPEMSALSIPMRVRWRSVWAI